MAATDAYSPDLCEEKHRSVDREMAQLRNASSEQWKQINRLSESLASLRAQVLMICSIGTVGGGVATALILNALGV